MTIEDMEKVANVSLHQRAALTMQNDQLQREWLRLHDALTDIDELVEGEADVDAGVPNLAMRIMVIVHAALGRDR